MLTRKLIIRNRIPSVMWCYRRSDSSPNKQMQQIGAKIVQNNIIKDPETKSKAANIIIILIIVTNR